MSTLLNALCTCDGGDGSGGLVADPRCPAHGWDDEVMPSANSARLPVEEEDDSCPQCGGAGTYTVPSEDSDIPGAVSWTRCCLCEGSGVYRGRA